MVWFILSNEYCSQLKVSAQNRPGINERIESFYISTCGTANTIRHIGYELICIDIQGMHSVCMLYDIRHIRSETSP